jgi:hypothetical protein
MWIRFFIRAVAMLIAGIVSIGYWYAHHAHWMRTESGWDQTGPLFLSGGILFTCLGLFFAALNYRRLQRPR